jgi:hypothetical protein
MQLFCFKLKKNFFMQRLGPKKHGVHFYVTCAAKNSKAGCDIERQPLGNTSNAATVAGTKRDVSLQMEKIKNIFLKLVA